MRIISGKARGTKIETIDDLSTRPTLDRVRESLFNILQCYIKNSIVMDLFAGSGALGIEALSRGAHNCTFCDINPEAIEIIKKNLEKTHLVEKASLFNMNYKKCLKKLKEVEKKFDIIFIDPPYKMNIAVEAVSLISGLGLLNNNGKIIIETDETERDIKELEKINNIKITDTRKYGRANLLFLSLTEEN